MSEKYIYQEISLKEKIWKIFKFFLIGLFFDALIVLFLYIIIYSPFFQVKEIKIHTNQISQKEVMDFIIINLFSNNVFINKILGLKNILIWPKNLENNLNNFYSLKNIEIKKDFFKREIEIFTNERETFGLWCKPNQNECWEFDKDGFLFKKTFFSEGNLILKVIDNSNQKINVGLKVLPDKFLNIFLNIIYILQKENINFSNITIENLDLEEIIVKIVNGPKIYFSLRFYPPDLKAIINNFQNKNIFDKLEYIDLRVENRIYYK